MKPLVHHQRVHRRMWQACLLIGLMLPGGLLASATAHAATSDPVEGQTREPAGNPGEIISLGVLVSTPALLQTGLSSGIELHGQLAPLWHRGAFAMRLGAAASWASSEEDSPHWHVTHHELRALLTLEAAWKRGAGAWLLRAGAGAAWVLEDRIRHQSARLPSGEITSSGQALAPEARLQLGARILIAAPISAVVRFGPSVRWVNGELAAGVAGSLEVAWTR